MHKVNFIQCAKMKIITNIFDRLKPRLTSHISEEVPGFSQTSQEMHLRNLYKQTSVWKMVFHYYR